MDINLITHETYLEIKVTGSMELEGAINYFDLLISTCNNYDIYKVLIDYSEAGPDMVPIDKFKYALEVKSQYTRHLESGGKPMRLASGLKVSSIH